MKNQALFVGSNVDPRTLIVRRGQFMWSARSGMNGSRQHWTVPAEKGPKWVEHYRTCGWAIAYEDAK